MNQFIDQLANLIPDCNNPSNKPDKLSILKFAATHCESKKESLSGKIQIEIHVPALRSDSLIQIPNQSLWQKNELCSRF